MADIREKIAVELENIENIFIEILQMDDLSKASRLELAGIGALLHNFYNSIENILKQILNSQGISIPQSSFWHKDLLEGACSSKIISSTLKEHLGPYLAFRHYFVHGYALDLKSDRILPLLLSCVSVYNDFKNQISLLGYTC
jgi:uncharacterized protein YutE (UPF0331/DUF86 family)